MQVTRRDWAIGAAVGAVLVVAAATGIGPIGPRYAGVVEAGAIGLGVLAGALVAVRRPAPVITLVLANAVTVAWFLWGFPTRMIVVVPLVLLYAAAAARGPRLAAAGFLLCAAVSAVTVRFLLGGSTWFDDRLVNAVTLTLCVAAIGTVVHEHRGKLRAIEELAERNAQAQVAMVRWEAAEHQVAMARELHDVVGHTLAAVRVQSRAALHVVDRMPEQARAALQSIADVSSSTIVEIQSLLAQLRAGRATEAGHATLARLDELIDTATRAGVATCLTVTGPIDAVAPGVDRVAFRVVQESLTNVVRHARATHAAVRIAAGPAELHLTVTDDGVGPVDQGEPAGTGIASMRERVTSMGGTFSAGAGENGFRVEARLPRAGGGR